MDQIQYIWVQKLGEMGVDTMEERQAGLVAEVMSALENVVVCFQWLEAKWAAVVIMGLPAVEACAIWELSPSELVEELAGAFIFGVHPRK